MGPWMPSADTRRRTKCIACLKKGKGKSVESLFTVKAQEKAGFLRNVEAVWPVSVTRLLSLHREGRQPRRNDCHLALILWNPSHLHGYWVCFHWCESVLRMCTLEGPAGDEPIRR